MLCSDCNKPAEPYVVMNDNEYYCDSCAYKIMLLKEYEKQKDKGIKYDNR